MDLCYLNFVFNFANYVFLVCIYFIQIRIANNTSSAKTPKE